MKKNFVKKYGYDEILSYIVVVYYLMYIFNMCFQLSFPGISVPFGGNLVYALFGIILMIFLNYILNGSYKVMFFLEGIFLLMYSYSYFSSYALKNVVIYYSIWTLLICIPLFCTVNSIKDKEIFYNIMVNFAPGIIIICVVTLFLNFGLGLNKISDYNLALPGTCLLFVFLNIEKMLEDFDLKYFIIDMIGVLACLLWGGRRVILVLFVYLIFKVVLDYRVLKMVVTALSIFMPFIIIAAVLLFRVIKSNKYESTYTSIRIVDKFLEGKLFSFSGRTALYDDSVRMIFEKPFVGRGLCGGWKDTGSYPHNIFLEIWQATGVFLGSIVILFIIFSILCSLKRSDKYNRKLVVVFLALSSQLLVSGPILNYVVFWILMALCFDKTNYKIKI